MKLIYTAAGLFSATILTASIAVAQQAPVPVQDPKAVVANNIQLVIDGKVLNVHDGDTVTVLAENNQKFNIRLHGIDAPELKQTFGTVSQQNLARMVLGKVVTIFWTKVDKYRRTVGTIKIDGRDINIEQVRAGLAWHFKKYADEQEPADRITYAAAQEQAKAAKLGLWQDPNPTAPGDWRQAIKAKRWGPPPPAGTIVGNSNSKRYHRPDCAGYRDMAEKNRVFFNSIEEAEAAGFKRAGNCPAEIQVLTPAAQPVPSFTPVATANPSASANGAAIPTVQTSAVVPTATVVATPAAMTDDESTDSDESESDESTESPVASPPAMTAQGPASPPAPPTESAPAPAAATNAAAPPSSVVTPAAKPAEPASCATPSVPVSASSNGHASDASLEKIIGNKNSRVYHLPGCSSYGKVSEKNQVKFDTASEAEKAGYKLAGNCSASKSVKE